MDLRQTFQASLSSVFLSQSHHSAPGLERDRCPISYSTETERLKARMGCKACMRFWASGSCEQDCNSISNSSNINMRPRRMPCLYRARPSRKTLSKQHLRRLVDTIAMAATTSRLSRPVKGKAKVIQSLSDILWMVNRAKSLLMLVRRIHV